MKNKTYFWYLPQENIIAEYSSKETATIISFIIQGDKQFWEYFVFLGTI